MKYIGRYWKPPGATLNGYGARQLRPSREPISKILLQGITLFVPSAHNFKANDMYSWLVSSPFVCPYLQAHLKGAGH